MAPPEPLKSEILESEVLLVFKALLDLKVQLFIYRYWGLSRKIAPPMLPEALKKVHLLMEYLDLEAAVSLLLSTSSIEIAPPYTADMLLKVLEVMLMVRQFLHLTAAPYCDAPLYMLLIVTEVIVN